MKRFRAVLRRLSRTEDKIIPPTECSPFANISDPSSSDDEECEARVLLPYTVPSCRSSKPHCSSSLWSSNADQDSGSDSYDLDGFPQCISSTSICNLSDHRRAYWTGCSSGTSSLFDSDFPKISTSDILGHRSRALIPSGSLTESKSTSEGLSDLSSPDLQQRRKLRVSPLSCEDETSSALSPSAIQAGDFLISCSPLQRTTPGRLTVEQQLPGTESSQLRRVGLLGSGSSGSVYLEKHVATGQLYAVKAILAAAGGGLAQEVSAIDTAIHPNLIRTHTAFVLGDSVHLVQEFMDLGSLRDLIECVGKIPDPILGSISTQILLGLSFLHADSPSGGMSPYHGRCKMVHRDLKPENILINSLGEVKIADFGILASMNGDTQRSTFIGTSRYMSPERISGEKYNEKSDIWAYGLVLIEMATGRHPCAEAASFLDLLVDITNLTCNVLPNAHPAPFRDHVRQCVLAEPTERPSARQLLSDAWIQDCSTSPSNVQSWLKTNLKADHAAVH
eukprot:NODE_1181_length_1659_cov_10.277640_g1048_i0.p1 GENE.NODE_1181_length_1659_cov_10.277640_g1048_i0~~NODE_1181_length_1659_cov_10.277640_g1048_i0.p1  ORF type:complete len:506 (+),score=80.11 NODE_1181_length_1659_cov_10.277640_g1048_i0:73-1590(+)